MKVLDDGEHVPFIYLGGLDKLFLLTEGITIGTGQGGTVTPTEAHTRFVPHLSQVAFRISGEPAKLYGNPPLVTSISLPESKLTVANYYDELGWFTRRGSSPLPIPRLTAAVTSVDNDVDVTIPVDNGSTTYHVSKTAYLFTGNAGLYHEHSHFPKHRAFTDADAIDDLIDAHVDANSSGDYVENKDEVLRLLMNDDFHKRLIDLGGKQPPVVAHPQGKRSVHVIYTQVDCSSSQWP